VTIAVALHGQAGLGDPPERALLRELSDEFASFMNLDVVAYRELRAGREEVTRRISSGLSSCASRRWPARPVTARDLLRRD
jgi:hypothetical protein